MVGGNHDLEGIDEFKTDEANLEAVMRIHNKPTPYFARQVGVGVRLPQEHTKATTILRQACKRGAPTRKMQRLPPPPASLSLL